ncbi:MAG: hypothetical protein ACOYM2_09600 [Rectinemataceae bacterium]
MSPRVFSLLIAIFMVARSIAADSFTFSADSVKSVLAKGKERTSLTGKARVKSDTINITADAIEISGSGYSTLVCKGNVEADDQKNGIHLSAPSLIYDRTHSIALLEGPSVLEDSKNKVVMKANWIQDDGDNGITVAQVNVRILKDGLACRSEYVVYRRANHVLELSGAPRVVRNGDEYRATRMVVNTDTEEIILEGAVAGSVHSEDSKPKAVQPAASGNAVTTPGIPAAAPPGTPSGVLPGTPAVKPTGKPRRVRRSLC